MPSATPIYLVKHKELTLSAWWTSGLALQEAVRQVTEELRSYNAPHVQMRILTSPIRGEVELQRLTGGAYGCSEYWMTITLYRVVTLKVQGSVVDRLSEVGADA